MKIALYGGFGEKGRTSLGIESDGFRLLLDAGVKTSAVGRADYYPAVTPGEPTRGRRIRTMTEESKGTKPEQLKNLELNKETLQDLTEGQAEAAEGGAGGTVSCACAGTTRCIP